LGKDFEDGWDKLGQRREANIGRLQGKEVKGQISSILLRTNPLINGDQHVVSFCMSRPQKLAVLQGTPANLGAVDDLMACEENAESAVDAVVEQDFH